APGADPGRIRLAFRGAERAALDASGALVLRAGDGALRLPAPSIYQEVAGHRRAVRGGYVVLRGDALSPLRIGFRLRRYDHRRPLIIDPTFAWVKSFGGSQTLEGAPLTQAVHGVAADALGTASVTGWTNSTDFPR